MGLFDKEDEELAPEQAYQIQNPAVKQYIADKFTPEARQALVKQNEEDASGPNFLGALAALGTGLQGGNAAEAGQRFVQGQQSMRDKKLTDFDSGRKMALEEETLGRDREKMARESDPNSEDSKLAQQLAIGMGVNPQLAGKLTAAKLKEQMPFIQKKFDIEQQKLERQDARRARSEDMAMQREFKLGERQAKDDEKKLLAEEKKKATTNEVEQRRQDIKANLALVKGQIEKDGTFELMGSHNQDIERRLDAVATDMAKLMDPTSVARPAEVDAIKRNLVESGFKNSNDTAIQILSNFEKEVDDRADNAYKIRGLESPQMAQSETVLMKSPDGKLKKVPRSQVQAALNAGGVRVDGAVAAK
jgi:hypothetical protein